MKKLSLKKLNLAEEELLQREQLKTVFGGYGTWEDGKCTMEMSCTLMNGNKKKITCSSDEGDCSTGSNSISCDNKTYYCQ